MLTTRHKSTLNQWLQPLAVRLSRLGVSPFTLTLAAPVLTLIVCIIFVRTHAVVLFCFTMAVVGALDGLDGAVARASGRVTKLGAYVDAMADRYVEIMVIVAAGIVTGYWALLLLALAGSLLVSYAKARAAMEVPVSNLEWPDLMERAERSAVFLIGLLLGSVCPWRPGGQDLFWWALWLLIILVHATVIQRTWRALRLIRSRSRP